MKSVITAFLKRVERIDMLCLFMKEKSRSNVMFVIFFKAPNGKTCFKKAQSTAFNTKVTLEKKSSITSQKKEFFQAL